MNNAVNKIGNRLSLRPPQRRSLELLDRIGEVLPLTKKQDVEACLQIIKSEEGFESVAAFERNFPSFCFALATGVGKTRLMGAFIAYLYEVHGLRHFFVLAPNLTIYNKLIVEFCEPKHPKYVFQGLQQFAVNPPGVVTGDSYEDTNIHSLDLMHEVVINIFNAGKITEGEREPGGLKFKRPREVIGPSYYDYLASLSDLVLLMDESHRYRAKGAMKAINELCPVLGLELTATPKVSGSGGADFKNVVYSYPLSEAMKDGFVKEPAVVTKENFRPQDYTPEALELVKLEDGVHVHEYTKVALETYANQTGQRLVRPFMLVVAMDIEHAQAIENLIKSGKFFEGRYADRVITVHSKQSGELADEMVERLLNVERTDSEKPTEIVIHVNKLGEGWDVTNLYTIVPLRRFVADILTEQTLGRGLRLPYGKRTGVDAVDTLNIIAHDKFQEIVDAAKNPNSVIKKGLVLGQDIPITRKVAVTVQPAFTPRVATAGEKPNQGQLVYSTEREKTVAMVVVETIREYEHLSRSSDLTKPEVKAQITAKVEQKLAVSPSGQIQLEIPDNEPKVDVAAIVDQVTSRAEELTFDLPRIVMQPKGETVIRFADFDLDVSGIHFQPVSQDLLVQTLSSDRRWKLSGGEPIAEEPRLENYIVRGLIAEPDIDYSAHADLLYKLAGQVVAHLKSYLREEQVIQVLAYFEGQLTRLVHAQMQAHRYVAPVEYEVTVSKGFMTLKATSFDKEASAEARNFKMPVEDKLYIRGMSFTGFAKCLYPEQKFQSDSERRLSVVLENDDSVLRWFKPAPGQFRIHMPDGGYEPDFIIETKDGKFLAEPKKASAMTDSDVLAKAEAAVLWCKHATDHELSNEGKPWKYLLIPHDAINASATLSGLAASYSRSV